MGRALFARAGPSGKHRLHPVEHRPAHQSGLAGGGHDPAAFRQAAGLLAPPADPLHPALHQVPRVGAVGEQPVHRGLAPEARPRRFARRQRLGGGGGGDALGVQPTGDGRAPQAGKGQREDALHHRGGGFVRQKMTLLGRVLLVAIQRAAGDAAPLPPLVGEHRPHIGGKVLQIPLVHQPVDLAALFARRVAGVHMVHQRQKPHSPQRKQPVQVLFHQLHVPGEAGLAFG